MAVQLMRPQPFGFKRPLALAAIASAAVLSCCNRPQAVQPRLFRMGERVEVGPLIYNILDTEWRTQLGEGAEARSPRNRFLLVQLSVTNSGIKESHIPPIVLEDSRGKTWPEETQGEGVTNWLGLLRKLAPAQTEQGRVLFDVPTGAYRLRVTDDSPEPGTEKTAFVDLPLRLEPEPLPQVLKEPAELTPPAAKP